MNSHRKPRLHPGPTSSPYPQSRLAPAFQATDLAAEVARAESMLNARTAAKLHVIGDQIKALQAAARVILDEARMEQALTQAQCGFKRIPGGSYHLYRKSDGTSFFSMLSPADWHEEPPHAFLGTYRLEADYSWTAMGKATTPGKDGELVAQLLEIR